MLYKTSKRSWSKWLPGWTGWKSNCNPSLQGLGRSAKSFAMLILFAVEHCRNSGSSSEQMRCVHLGVDALACAAMAGSGAGCRASPNSLAEDGRPGIGVGCDHALCHLQDRQPRSHTSESHTYISQYSCEYLVSLGAEAKQAFGRSIVPTASLARPWARSSSLARWSWFRWRS